MEGRGALIVLAAIHRETELVCSHRTTKSLPALVVLALENRPLGLDRVFDRGSRDQAVEFHQCISNGCAASTLAIFVVFLPRPTVLPDADRIHVGRTMNDSAATISQKMSWTFTGLIPW